MCPSDISENFGESRHCKNLKFENWKWWIQDSSMWVARISALSIYKVNLEQNVILLS